MLALGYSFNVSFDEGAVARQPDGETYGRTKT